MAAAFAGVYIVGKGEHVFVIIVVILQRDFNRCHFLLFGFVAACGYIHGLLVQNGLFAVKMLNEVDYAALVAEGAHVGRFGALVAHGYSYARVKESKLAHSVRQNIEIIVHLIKYLIVGKECYAGAAFAFGNVLYGLNGGLRLAIGIFLIIKLAVALYFGYKPCGQRIDNTQAHAMQTAGDLIAAAAEFAARVQHRKRNLQRALMHLFMHVNGYAAAVIGNGNGIVAMDCNFNMVAVSAHGLVNGVIHQLLHQMVQPVEVR